MRVVLAGGGTAGHIEPALALADALREADSSIQVTCLGTRQGLETRLVPLRGYELELIPAVPLPRSVTPALLTVPGRLAGAVHATGKILDRVGADVVVGFGGYVATPAYLAARRHGVPIVVHEANPSPGIANRLGARLSTHVFTGHPDTRLRNARYIGLPIRRQIAELDRFALGDEARAFFGLRPDLPVLLVFGGSQGARSLNRAAAGAASAIRSAGVQILHITGPRNAEESQETGGAVSSGPGLSGAGSSGPGLSGSVPYVAVPYVDQMELAYAAADFALCRAGAMTCAELTAVGLPAAYVPLPIGNGEQRANALPIVQRGGGLLVEDAELTPEWIRTALLPVLTNIDQVAGMSEAAAASGRKYADRWLAKAVIDIVAAEQAGRAASGTVLAEEANPAEQPAPAGQPRAEEQGSLFIPHASRQSAPAAEQRPAGAPQAPAGSPAPAASLWTPQAPVGPPGAPRALRGSGRRSDPHRRRGWLVALAAFVLVVGALIGVTLSLTGGSGTPAAAGATKPDMQSTAGGGTGASPSMSASPGTSMAASMTSCTNEQPGDGNNGPTTLSAVLADANGCSVPKNLIPPKKCASQPAPSGEQIIACTSPIPQITQVTFRTYPTLSALYGAYKAEVSSLDSTGTFQQNTRESCGDTAVFYAEAGWNHQELHPRQYTVAEMAKGKVPQLDAMGRLACFAHGKSQDLVWTTGVGKMLAVAIGTGSASGVYDWWAAIHHVIVFPDTEMCGMSGRMESVPEGNLIQAPVCPAGAGMSPASTGTSMPSSPAMSSPAMSSTPTMSASMTG